MYCFSWTNWTQDKEGTSQSAKLHHRLAWIFQSFRCYVIFMSDTIHILKTLYENKKKNIKRFEATIIQINSNTVSHVTYFIRKKKHSYSISLFARVIFISKSYTYKICNIPHTSLPKYRHNFQFDRTTRLCHDISFFFSTSFVSFGLPLQCLCCFRHKNFSWFSGTSTER